MLSAETSDILAICVLAALGSSLAGWIVLKLRRSPFSPAQSVLYALNYVLARVLWRVQIRGRFPIPPDQGAVIVCNHRCPLDPSFIALAVPRVVHWMVAREYCESPAFRRLLRTMRIDTRQSRGHRHGRHKSGHPHRRAGRAGGDLSRGTHQHHRADCCCPAAPARR